MRVANLYGVLAFLAYGRCIIWEYNDYVALVSIFFLIIYFGENILYLLEDKK